MQAVIGETDDPLENLALREEITSQYLDPASAKEKAEFRKMSPDRQAETLDAYVREPPDSGRKTHDS
jgi:hypothetical protein